MGMGWDSLDGRGKGSATEIDRKRSFDQIGGNHNPTSAPDAARTRRIENQKQQMWHEGWLNQAYRTLQPNGIIKAFSGTRTFHRLAVAMKEAGFTDIHLEVWAYGSGFPKSYNIGQSVQKLLTTGKARRPDRDLKSKRSYVFVEGGYPDTGGKVELTETGAMEWKGWGTALKPSWEPVLVGRKPE